MPIRPWMIDPTTMATTEAGMQMMRISVRLNPSGSISPIITAMAAETGLEVMPSPLATVDAASGRSGRTPFLYAVSSMTGMREKKMLLVPAPTVKTKLTSGAMIVICFGLLWMMREAIFTRKSVPPAACIAAAAEITAMMISMALIGGSPGGSLRTKAKNSTPTPPQRPSPIPPERTPRKMKTMRAMN